MNLTNGLFARQAWHWTGRSVACALSLACAFASGIATAQTPVVQVEALFPKAAVLKVNGERKMLRVGQSFSGVTLVASKTKTATIKFNGKTQTLGLSQHIGSSYETPTEQRISLARDAYDQYRTSILINGRSVLALVDTGASSVAMSGDQAKALGIDYYGGILGKVSTASGISDAYSITLRSVSVGGITVENVRGSVIEGDYPSIVLLGMTYLRHVKMEEEEGVLSLSRIN